MSTHFAAFQVDGATESYDTFAGPSNRCDDQDGMTDYDLYRKGKES